MTATVIGLILALGGPPLVAVSGEKLEGTAADLALGLLAQGALLAICGAVLAILVHWEGQPLAAIGLLPLAWSSLAWAAVLAAFFRYVFTPAVVWFFHRFEIAVFGAGLSKLAVLPSWYLVLAVVIGGTIEEILYRGYAVERLAAASGSYGVAALLSVLAFGLAHVPLWGWAASTTTFVSGGVATLFYLWRRDIDALIIAHVFTDFVGIVIRR